MFTPNIIYYLYGQEVETLIQNVNSNLGYKCIHKYFYNKIELVK